MRVASEWLIDITHLLSIYQSINQSSYQSINLSINDQSIYLAHQKERDIG